MIPLDVALRIARRRCDAANVLLILPDDPRRLAIVGLIAAAHAIQGTGVSFARVSLGVTVTLPGAPGVVATLLSLVPVVGPALAALASAAGRTLVCLSPAALNSGDALLATVEHELGHVGTIAIGGLPLCLAYLVAPEARAGTEAPCYGASMAVAVACGVDVDEAAAGALMSLSGYGLDPAARDLAAGLIASARETIRATGDLGGVVAEMRRELAAEGVVLA